MTILFATSSVKSALRLAGPMHSFSDPGSTFRYRQYRAYLSIKIIIKCKRISWAPSYRDLPYKDAGANRKET